MTRTPTHLVRELDIFTVDAIYGLIQVNDESSVLCRICMVKPIILSRPQIELWLDVINTT